MNNQGPFPKIKIQQCIQLSERPITYRVYYTIHDDMAQAVMHRDIDLVDLVVLMLIFIKDLRDIFKMRIPFSPLFLQRLQRDKGLFIRFCSSCRRFCKKRFSRNKRKPLSRGSMTIAEFLGVNERALDHLIASSSSINDQTSDADYSLSSSTGSQVVFEFLNQLTYLVFSPVREGLRRLLLDQMTISGGSFSPPASAAPVNFTTSTQTSSLASSSTEVFLQSKNQLSNIQN